MGIAGQTVSLTDAGPDNNLNTLADNVFTATTTDAFGYYSFANRIVGRNYRVNFEPVNGWMFSNGGQGTVTTDSNVVLRNDYTLDANGSISGGLVNGYDGQTAAISYATTAAIQYHIDAGIFRSAAVGPGHDLDAKLFMGLNFATDIDAEGNGQPNATATGDDASNTGSADDETAVTIPALNPGAPATFIVKVTNLTGQDAYLYAFIDWNKDGNFSGVNETRIVAVPTGTQGDAPVLFNVPSDAVLDTDLGARFRLSSAANLGPYDYIQLIPIENFEAQLTNVSREAPDGEVEDYLVRVRAIQQIGDFVWHDLNGNGLQDAGEPGIPGVTVRLLDSTGTNVLQTTITDANGYYLFDVDPDTYIVEFVRPAGYLPSPANVGSNDAIDSDADPVTGRTGPIVIGVGQIDLTWDAGFYLPGSIGNYVWVDENSDGYQDAGEPGLPNVQVNLYNANGVLVATTFTDVDGGYLFSNLAPGTYYVDVLDGTGNQPYSLPFPGMTQTPYNLPGADFGNQNHNAPIPNTSFTGYQVVLPAGGENLTADFGYNYNPTVCVDNPADPACTDPSGSIGDWVWVDTNGDGVQDPEEIGIPGVCVELVGPGPDGLFGTADDAVLATTTTNATGYYIFDGLPPNAYVVRMCASNFQPGGPLDGYTQTGDPDYFGQPLPAGQGDNQTTTPIILGPGDVFLNADFGYQPPAAQNNSIGDKVWFDANANGVGPNGNGAAPGNDNTEYGIPGVTVALIRDINNNGIWDAGEPIIATTVTDANGDYLFTGLPDGSYLVWVSDTDNVLGGKTPTYDVDGGAAPVGSGAPIGVASSSVLGLSSSLNLGVGDPNPASDLTQDFGYTAAGQTPVTGLIGDRVWLDINGDGVQDANEPGLEGIRVELYDSSNNLIGVTFTDENGYYYFGGLPAGTYTVVVTPPPGLTQTYDADDSTGPFGTPHQSTVTIGPGGINLDQDFGYRGTGTIGDLVWEDLNADGVRQAGEPGIPGVTLDLYWDLNGNGVIDPGEPLIGSTVTDANGGYLFSGLPVDDGGGNAQFVVVVTDVDGVLGGYWHSLGTPGQNNNSQTDPYAVTLTPTEPNNLTADFGYYVRPACVGNFVWYDLNGNGIQDAGEPGIDGVMVQVVITYPNGNSTTLRTVTGDNPNQAGTQAGWYSFCNLLQDEDYRIGSSTTPGANQPAHVTSIDVTQPALAAYTPTQIGASGSNDLNDSNDPAGTVAVPVQGLTNTSQQAAASEPMNASYDFGFQAADWGDLPDVYNTTAANNGARHFIDATNPTPILGVCVDSEANGVPTAAANGDDSAVSPVKFGDTVCTDDEDGVTPVNNWTNGTGQLLVTISDASACLNAWMDFATAGGAVQAGGNGTFDYFPGSGASEWIIQNQVLPVGANQMIVFPLPNGLPPGDYYVRVRATPVNQAGACDPDAYAGGTPTWLGAAKGGEVEDYRIDTRPLNVALDYFTATAQGSDVLLEWVTMSEIDLLGFDLYRATSAAGPWTRLNNAVIPAQTPGSTTGNVYTWRDANLNAGTYWYRLDGVETTGTAPTSTTQVQVGTTMRQIFVPLIIRR